MVKTVNQRPAHSWFVNTEVLAVEALQCQVAVLRGNITACALASCFLHPIATDAENPLFRGGKRIITIEIYFIVRFYAYRYKL